jgi:hypothetical protein
MAFLEDQIREMLRARGADRELEDFAAAAVRDLYQQHVEAENYRFSLTLPDSISPDDAEQLRRDIQSGLESMREDNHAIVVRLIAELVLARVRIFQQERSRTP